VRRQTKLEQVSSNYFLIRGEIQHYGFVDRRTFFWRRQLGIVAFAKSERLRDAF
jgi:hypothetical protein